MNIIKLIKNQKKNYSNASILIVTVVLLWLLFGVVILITKITIGHLNNVDISLESIRMMQTEENEIQTGSSRDPMRTTSLIDEASSFSIRQRTYHRIVEIFLPVDYVYASKFGEDGEVMTATKQEGTPDVFI